MFSCKEYMRAKDELFCLFESGAITREEWMVQRELMQFMI